jgi:hypothetical protein
MAEEADDNSHTNDGHLGDEHRPVGELDEERK